MALSCLSTIKSAAKINVSKGDLMQIAALISASLGSFTFGALFAWLSPGIPKLLTPEYGLTLEETSYLAMVGPLSMALWSPPFCKLVDTIGRKYTLLACSVIYSISWLLTAFAGNTYYLYMISRFVSGIGDACCWSTAPTYVAEVARPRIRDLFGNSIMISLFFAQFLVNLIGFYCDIPTTCFIMLIFPVIFTITFVFMPESPYYCCMKGQMDRARKSLQLLHWKDDVEEELVKLSSDVERQLSERGTFKDLWVIPSNRKALMIANLVRTFQQLAGLTAMITYAQYIFEQSGTDISSGAAAIVFNGLLTAFCLVGNAVAARVGKPLALAISGVGSGLAMLAVTLYVYFDKYTEVDVTIANYVPVVGLILYISCFTLGLAMIPTALIGELFSTSIRSKAAMISNMVFALYIAGMNKLIQFLMEEFGLFVPFLFLTVSCFIAAVGSYIIVPDTRGKSLEEIQQILKGNKR